MSVEDWQKGREQIQKKAGDRPRASIELIRYKNELEDRNFWQKFQETGCFHASLGFGWPKIGRSFLDLFEQFIQPNYPNTKILQMQLTRLHAGEVIRPHRDGLALAICHRIHVPIITNPEVDFYIQREPFYFPPGKIFELNNCVMHSVFNRSTQGRTHLIIDLLPEETGTVIYDQDPAVS